jgi:hypothetical protein
MASSLRRLREKLCRELAQSEHDAIIHCEREASRYGARPPGEALRAVADHARQIRPLLEGLLGKRQGAGIRAARMVAEVFSAVRHFAVDWIIDAERSYRATLLGLYHGLGVAGMLREVVVQQHDHDAVRLCDELLEGRTQLLSRAEACVRWFADHPELALRSSRRKLARAHDRQEGVSRPHGATQRHGREGLRGS